MLNNKFKTMKRIGITIILFFISLSIFAQLTIKGKILSEKGEPLVGANIIIEGTSLGTSSDIEGNFFFNNLKKSNYTIQISYVGYKNTKVLVEPDKAQDLLIQLEPLNFLSDEVIVTATRVNEKTPMAFININKATIEKNNKGNDIPYLLSLTPSLVETSEAGIGIGYTSMRIRGIDHTRINVTINGIPLNDAESQGVYWVDIPDLASSVQDIQIQRGVGASTNGAGAFGATINLKTESIHSEPYTEINSSYGSFNTIKNNIQVGSGLIKDHFCFDARISKLRSDGYIDYSDSDHESFFVSGTYYSDKALIKANIFKGKEKTGISWWGVPEDMLETNRTYNPAGEYIDIYGLPRYYKDQTDNYLQTHYQLISSLQLTKNIQFNMALHYTKGEGYYEQYKSDEDFADYGLPYILLSDTVYRIGARTLIFPDSTIRNSDIIRRKWMDNDFYGITYSANFDYGKTNTIIGGSWNKYDGNHYGKILWSEFGNNFTKDFQWYINSGIKTDFNVFGKLNYSIISNLNFYADIQYRNVNYKMEGIDDDLKILDQEHNYHFINPKAGLFYNINPKFDAYISYAIANREPTRSDFKNAVGDEQAMPKPETLYDLELGGNFKLPDYMLSVNFYYMDYKDQLVNTGQKSNVGYDIQTNVENSYRAGIEIMNTLKILDFFQWKFNLTLSQNKIKNFIEYSDYYGTDWNYLGNLPKELGETDISYSPNIIGSNVFTFNLFKKFEIDFITKYVGKQYFDNTSDKNRMLDPYLINNLLLTYTPNTRFTKKMSIYLQVNNILNAKYESNAYGGNWYENAASISNYQQAEEKSWSYYYPQAGINFMAGLSITF